VLADSGDEQSWAPADCTLPSAEQPLRAAEFDDLFSGQVLRADRAETGRLRLELRPDREVAARAAALAAAETQCCAFFTFTLTAATESLVLDITVPQARADILDALADRAARAGGADAATGLRATP
jgi:hypothetical protein